MEGSIQSGYDERSSMFKVFQDCIFYLEEDEEIPTVNLNSDGYFINDLGSGALLRWYCTWFDDDHNHDMLDAIHCEMLPGHRKMFVSDIHQMNHMMKVGIGPPHIYRSLSLQAGGYHKIGFKKKDLYNQIHRQRREQSSNVVAALRYLHEIRSKDPMMYFEHTIDSEGRLQHLLTVIGQVT
ncbi:hypothetical protein SESBI_36454 [Sesbania bispinosa]|nr:hypothetical protein SESBI_36454 [Sesbania bispinosa]